MEESIIPRVVDALGEFSWGEIFEGLRVIILRQRDTNQDVEERMLLSQAYEHLVEADTCIYLLDK